MKHFRGIATFALIFAMEVFALTAFILLGLLIGGFY